MLDSGYWVLDGGWRLPGAERTLIGVCQRSAPGCGGQVHFGGAGFRRANARRSDDQGSTWQATGLVPMFEGVQQIETGPADYLLAYWMARFHGFITEEQATAPW